MTLTMAAEVITTANRRFQDGNGRDPKDLLELIGWACKHTSQHPQSLIDAGIVVGNYAKTKKS